MLYPLDYVAEPANLASFRQEIRAFLNAELAGMPKGPFLDGIGH